MIIESISNRLYVWYARLVISYTIADEIRARLSPQLLSGLPSDCLLSS